MSVQEAIRWLALETPRLQADANEYLRDSHQDMDTSNWRGLVVSISVPMRLLTTAKLTMVSQLLQLEDLEGTGERDRPLAETVECEGKKHEVDT